MAEFLTVLRRFASKVETVPGTAETLVSADNDNRVHELAVGSLDVPFDEDPSKYATGDFGMGEAVAGPTSAKITFKTKFVKSAGNGAAEPNWTKFIKAAGCSVAAYDSTLGSGYAVYPDAAKAENTLSAGIYEMERGANPSGLFYQFVGCMGNMVMTTEGTGKPYNMAWEFTGGLNDITDVTEAAIPDLTGAQTDIPDRFLDGFFTIGGVSGCISTMEFNLGNVISPVQCIGADSGYSKFALTNMQPMLTINPLVSRTSTYDAWGKFIAGSIETVEIETSQFHLSIPRAQITTLAPEDADGIQRWKIGLRPLRPTTAGSYNYAPWTMFILNSNA